MSNMVLPALPGFDISLKRTAEWKNTVRETGSGREFALRQWVAPRYRYEMKLNLLRAGTERELQQFLAFFNTHRGSYDTWLFEDPDDRAVTLEQFGIGNGTATQFQLTRSWDTWVDAIYELNGAPTLYRNTGDWLGDARLYTAARTNLLTYSDQFDNAAWSKTASTVTADATTDPAGGTTADLLTVSTSLAGARVTQSKAVTASGQHTFSVYLKAGTAPTARLLIYNQTTATTIAGALFDLSTGAVSSITGDAAQCELLPGGWVRAQLTCPAVTAGQTLVVYVYPRNSGNNAGDTVYAWRAQLEAGAAATRPIATTSAAVTAPADYSIDSKGLATFGTAPALGALLKWSGAYFWRCRFDSDAQDVERFLHQMYEARKVMFHTVKP